jgi:hypothetical protein
MAPTMALAITQQAILNRRRLCTVDLIGHLIAHFHQGKRARLFPLLPRAVPARSSSERLAIA